MELFASSILLEVFLAQKKVDIEVYPFQSASRPMKSAEKKYSTLERETSPMIFILNKLWVYMLSVIPLPLSPIIKSFAVRLRRRKSVNR